MTIEPLTQVWVLFIASPDEALLQQITRWHNGRSSQYRINGIIPVVGAGPPELAPSWGLVRLEGPSQLTEELPSSAEVPLTIFRGVTQHLHYTNAIQRQELEARSRTEVEPSSETTAVLIPIGKSRQWWQLAQDQRQAHFHPGDNYQGHTAIGLRYVDRIFRKLYHSRCLNAPTAYDFLTYFEFNSVYKNDFNTLLNELRDSTRNPEWAHVELEYEIWMTKKG
ncbi:MAG TPA: chlorite dismutase family protein [Anaerolineae bacterium]|nr:chlorite dismutase family protein [Anaerolineae bacterium]